MASTGTRRREVDPRSLVTGRVLAVAGVVGALVVLLVVGRLLIRSGDPDQPTYRAVPDRTLFRDVARLDGVRDAQLTWDTGADPAAYTGTVVVGPHRKLCPVLDRVYAILRQGRQGAVIHVAVTKAGGRILHMEDVDAGVAADPASRYGAQPGTGAPLDDRLCSPET